MTDQVTNDQPTEQVQEINPVEQEARASGWVPKEEYQGDENKWVDAAEFVRRGPLFEKINASNREIKELKKALDQLSAHHRKVKETSFQEALAALREEKKAAYVEGDPDKIVEIDDKIADIKDQQKAYAAAQAAEAAKTVQQEIHPTFQNWVARNTWYNTSEPMRAYADALGKKLHQSGLTPDEVLKQVEAQVKEEFPNKFRNANRDKAPAVEGASTAGKSGGARYNLTAEERMIMERFVRQKVMTEEQYIAELKKVKG